MSLPCSSWRVNTHTCTHTHSFLATSTEKHYLGRHRGLEEGPARRHLEDPISLPPALARVPAHGRREGKDFWVALHQRGWPDQESTTLGSSEPTYDACNSPSLLASRALACCSFLHGPGLTHLCAPGAPLPAPASVLWSRGGS